MFVINFLLDCARRAPGARTAKSGKKMMTNPAENGYLLTRIWLYRNVICFKVNKKPCSDVVWNWQVWKKNWKKNIFENSTTGTYCHTVYETGIAIWGKLNINAKWLLLGLKLRGYLCWIDHSRLWINASIREFQDILYETLSLLMKNHLQK